MLVWRIIVAENPCNITDKFEEESLFTTELLKDFCKRQQQKTNNHYYTIFSFALTPSISIYSKRLETIYNTDYQNNEHTFLNTYLWCMGKDPQGHTQRMYKKIFAETESTTHYDYERLASKLEECKKQLRCSPGRYDFNNYISRTYYYYFNMVYNILSYIPNLFYLNRKYCIIHIHQNLK